jgi:hypothetical protein
MKTLLKTIFPLLLLGFDHLAFGQLKPLEERFAWPLPFSLQDLNKFKEHSVTTISYLPDALIEQKGSKPKIRTFYYFNELGQLVYEKTPTYKKRYRTYIGTYYDESTPSFEGKYSYDLMGNIVSAIKGSVQHKFLDTIAYNASGQIIYYGKFSIWIEKKKTIVDTFTLATLHSTKNSNYTLIDSSFTDNITYFTLDSNNNLVETKTANYLETTITEIDGEGKTHIKTSYPSYYFTDFIYKDTRLIEKISGKDFTSVGGLVNETSYVKYTYNQNGNLSGVIPEGYKDRIFINDNIASSCIFFTYNSHGLVKSTVEIKLERTKNGYEPKVLVANYLYQFKKL